MDEDLQYHIVIPGVPLISSNGFLQGHGTYISSDHGEEPLLVSDTIGTVDRVNRLVSVKPLKSRYLADVGDLVIGRILEVGKKLL